MKRFFVLLLAILLVVGFLLKDEWLGENNISQNTGFVQDQREYGSSDGLAESEQYKMISCPEITILANKTLQAEINEINRMLTDAVVQDENMENAIETESHEEIPRGPDNDFLGVYCETTRNDNVVFSQKVNQTTYGAGAVHSNNSVETMNYSVKTGEELNLDDLFEPNSDGKITLTRLVVAKLKTDLGEVLNKEIAETQEGEELEFDLFLVESDGLRILFNQYAIAPSSAGIVEVKLSRDELGSSYLY
ncbi:MAG: RsiV family protein [Patescibacteria group bacterium]|jgi:hypothetical protein